MGPCGRSGRRRGRGLTARKSVFSSVCFERILIQGRNKRTDSHVGLHPPRNDRLLKQPAGQHGAPAKGLTFCGERKNKVIRRCADACVSTWLYGLVLTPSLRSQCAHWLWQSVSPKTRNKQNAPPSCTMAGHFQSFFTWCRRYGRLHRPDRERCSSGR